MFTAFGMLFCAGARIEHLTIAALAMLPPVVLAIGSSAYQRARILAFLDPWKDAAEHRLPHRPIAAGVGQRRHLRPGPRGLAPEVLLSARGAHRLHLRGHRRRAGLLGTLVVLALFAAFAVRAFVLAQRTTDRFGFFLIVGCALLIVIQAFINIGVVTSSWPVTGVPLPFISFGGTSLDRQPRRGGADHERRAPDASGARRSCFASRSPAAAPAATFIPRSRSTTRCRRPLRPAATTSRASSERAADSKRNSSRRCR